MIVNVVKVIFTFQHVDNHFHPVDDCLHHGYTYFHHIDDDFADYY